jgi:hypothetical protein
MANEILIEAVNSLSPEEQASVLQFIDYLKRQKCSLAIPSGRRSVHRGSS